MNQKLVSPGFRPERPARRKIDERDIDGPVVVLGSNGRGSWRSEAERQQAVAGQCGLTRLDDRVVPKKAAIGDRRMALYPPQKAEGHPLNRRLIAVEEFDRDGF
ncbi:hypothetical protein JZX87_15880 [Agrobacterium sp. Ap1]|uniref:hypothetical protein n=1 Tax=Agrobacterium sp. Ap1 TaxID=2815337 RepID=UPI001A8C19E6|nr:hypothetical protein [Agrobacterium sp. Ap1]MBO0142648.1 hypothetical protein [Agrobacterium sp. Ap1]